MASIVLTDDYRLHPYIATEGSNTTIARISDARASNASLRCIFGTVLDPKTMWLSEALPGGLRVMAADWVLHFNCNPDLILARPIEEQNSYLATRDRLGLPDLRWAADLWLMAERQNRAIRDACTAVSTAEGQRTKREEEGN